MCRYCKIHLKNGIVSFINFIKLITVEPSMVLYMMAFMTTSIVEQAFFVDKACRVNHNFTQAICDDISNPINADANKHVQLTVSEFHQWNDIAGHGGQIILAFFMGAWSDKRGRKIPLLLGLIGKCYYSVMIVVNSVYYTWPVEYVIYTATLPMTITGADVAIFAAAFAYISDISSSNSRTLRVTILEVCYLATMPTGIALGKFLFSDVTNRSYTIMFIINASLLVAAIIYTGLRLKMRTNDKQRPISDANNVVTDFFDYKHVVDTFKTIFKRRQFTQRAFLLLLILAMATYTFQRDERQMSYLYLQWVFNWNFDQVSTFRTFQSAIQDVMLLVAIPLMSKLLGWRDTIIALIGALAHIAARIFYASANVGWMFYLGGVFASLGPVVAPIIRSMVSKLVAVAERGKVFSMLAVADNAIPIVSATVYNQVYKKTLHNHPEAIFYVTIASQVVVLCSFLFIHCTASSESLSHREIEESVDDADHLTDPTANKEEIN
ncbi:solute carrier family 46 member 3 isoform X3 [Photinus pyralis]|uniref:Major facilitator superfamily (MFS) profile domain-containing protein n=1 Tax=Photinus pyralis TaxID=7054 RepID=A0A1Y1KT46_PHOPY|nr:solute carrier family 46 member 3 isoform X3 [Photinus pyralis]